MSPPSQSSGSQTAFGRFAGAGCAGVAELLIFHPVDTVAKRLMNSKEAFGGHNATKILFQEHAESGLMQKYGSLFPGIGYGAVYKICQRVYKFGGQPYVKEAMQRMTGTDKNEQTKFQTFLLNGVSGSVMGAGEVVLLPFDVMKIKAQTNPEYRKLTMSQVFQKEGMGLYKGWQWTMARNVPGSFALFGGNALAMSFLNVPKGERPSFLQTSFASLVGSVTSIIVACPLDVVKTRIQSGSFGDTGGVAIITKIVKEEGVSAFFKGSVPKVVTVGPKLIFSFTVAQYLMALWS